MWKSNGLMTLVTDFGTVDGYVGAMKGVVLSHAPTAAIHDITHAIPAQDVGAAAWCLGNAVPWFPEGTLHVAVVDPGVGTDRVILAAEYRGQVILAPDNGMISFLCEPGKGGVRALKPDVRASGTVSTTFHGRDMFAYAAGLLLSGRSELLELSDPVESWVDIAHPPILREEGKLTGAVVHIDRFGNAITNILSRDLPGNETRGMVVSCGTVELRAILPSYGHAEDGDTLALSNSSGRLEIAVREGSAADVHRIRIGDPVTVRFI